MTGYRVDRYRSVETRVDNLGRLLLREGTILHVVRLLHVFASEDLVNEVCSEFAQKRVALDDVVDLAVDERLHAILHRVDRHDLDVDTRYATRGLNGLDCT